MSSDALHIEAARRLEVLNQARAFEDLLQSPGWNIVFAYRTAIVEKMRTDLLKVDTGDVSVALDALQRWQIAEQLLDAEARYVNNTLDAAQTIRGSITMDDALLMEKVKNEQPEPRSRPDPAGY